ncbi:hypothetical protein KP79_PYT26136 [Mizuhopecten yessoensis]|uniref:Reverse transcriptase domain-containing protein n=1 Tax=Mizuhopecten yessoensis TaxID=6573 RepID=A0A210QH44_MIZYE|nr:hypothetical protein KP79_PYT26136 [Mizuhopecten yessoensis]
MANHVSPILTIIFSLSIETGNIPSDWKKANVSPVYKKVEKYKAENYRPISLTCICCKILSHIMNHTDRYNILYPLQHRFRRQRSCETQLLEFVEDITKNMSDKKQTDILVRVFSKAFDKVCHSLLFHKLQHYGI